MHRTIDELAVEYQAGRLSRRAFLSAMTALVASPRLIAQGGGPASPIAIRRYQSCSIAVTDVGKSVEWYTKLFGMTPQAMQGSTSILRLGAGPMYLAIAPRGNNPPSITTVGIAVENYDPQRLVAALTAAGVKAEVRMRGPELGGGGAGAPQGTPEVYFTTPVGGLIHLQHPDNAGGSGIHGEVVRAVAASTTRAPVPLTGYNHLQAGPREFWEKVFGMKEQARQGPNTILMGMGAGPAFLTISQAGANHICMTMKDFDANAVMGALTANGLEPVEFSMGGGGAASRALTCRTRLRQQANNGGGPTHPLGTYELYGQDPDNIGFQIQDEQYCGGSGRLGQICP